MKSIINGKRYDTEKSILVGEGGSRGLSITDFGYWEAGLYVTPRSGAYFLAGSGGPMTMWAKPCGSGRTGGEGIIPLSGDGALEWAERYLTTEQVEAHFGAVVEDA